MKHIRSHSGFTLLEIMVALGIASILGVTIMNTMNMSMFSSGDLRRTGEINNLIQRITTELSRQEVCNRNFAGGPVVRASIPSITGKSGLSPIITENQAFDSQSEYQVLNITSAAAGLSKMNITVNYRSHARRGEVIPDKSFVIPLNVYLDSVTGNIKNCFSDIDQLLIDAVRYSCQGNNYDVNPLVNNYGTIGNNGVARYYPPGPGYRYGHCEHAVELKDTNGVNIAPVPVSGLFTCPPGQLLKNISVPGTPGPVPANKQRMVFECRVIGNPPLTCPAWSYLGGIDVNGNAICLDIRSMFPNGGFMTIRAGVFSAINLTCPNGWLLQSLNPGTGAVNCVPARLPVVCGVNQYVTGFNFATGAPTCGSAKNSNVCAFGTYMTSINTVGDVTCDYPIPLGGCPGNLVITGINAAGGFICQLNPP